MLIPWAFDNDQLWFAAQAKPAWQLEWEKTFDAAKKEGQVVVYISGYEAILPDFEKEFPEIKVVAITGEEINSDRAARRNGARKNFIADVSSTGQIPITNSFTSPRRSIQSSRR